MTESNLIPSEIYDAALNDAVEYYKLNREFHSPYLGQVKITKKGFQHLENKGFKNQRKRNPKDAYVRLKCFPHVGTLLRKLGLPQEYKCVMENVTVKRGSRLVTERRQVQYYAFIGILYSNMRVKIVIRKPDGYEKSEFHSIQPAWVMNSYHDMQMRGDMFIEEVEGEEDNLDEFIDELVEEDTKKANPK
ncbi:hypothetical protein GW846_03340 [Candidatus Gracilibacteria bacterium]|nr:hypothetical protein [Candidatus Gracilibacteria bacterium]